MDHPCRAMLLALACALLATGVKGSPAPKGTPSPEPLNWNVDSVVGIGCSSNATRFMMRLSGYSQSDGLRVVTQADAAGLRYMDEASPPLSEQALHSWGIYTASNGGPVTASFPIPQDTAFVIRFMLTRGLGGPAIFQREVTIDRCNGGSIVRNEVVGDVFHDSFES